MLDDDDDDDDDSYDYNTPLRGDAEDAEIFGSLLHTALDELFT